MISRKSDMRDLLIQADALLDAGRLQDARALYQEILTIDPEYVEAWLMVAALDAESGAVESALACCERVLQLAPDNAEAYSMQGRLLASQGKLHAARDSLFRSVELDKDDGESWGALAGLFLKLGDFSEAARCSRASVKLLPRFLDGYINLGNALAGMGHSQDAYEAYIQAIALQEENVLARQGVALSLEQMQKWEDAKKAYQKTLEKLPGNLDCITGLARVYCALGEWDAAEQLLAPASTAFPADARLHQVMGRLYFGKKSTEKAEFHYRQATLLAPDRVTAWVDLGNFMQELQRMDDALTHYRQALKISAQHPDVHFNIGVCYQRQNRFVEALHHLEQAIENRPDFVDAHWYKSFISLLIGDYEVGWDEYEWRLKQKNNQARPFSQPVWDGSDIAGRTILVHDEQGYGDTFQFVRFLPLVKAAGARVIFECHPKLSPILRACQGYDLILERDASGEGPNTTFDTQIHLMSLPKVFKTRLGSIPVDVPYIDVDHTRVSYWHDRISDDKNFRVGIAWAGSANHTNELNRSCRLTDFLPVINMPGVSVYSLQKGPGAEQADELAHVAGVKRIDKELDLTERFVDTAALMKNLDLIISIDTSIAHLAGALGCEIWTLLCSSPDWRWMNEGQKSHWYPSMRLFRQEVPGDWSTVVARVTEALRARMLQKEGVKETIAE